MSTAAVLVLNVDYSPLEVISWRKAMEKIVIGKVELVTAYIDRVIRSPSTEFPFPAVVRLVGRYARRRVRLARRNILARDAHTCQYCGIRPPSSELTVDHVVPKAHARGGRVRLPNGDVVRVNSWVNEVAACRPCNTRKADRTPAQAAMKLRRLPRVPSRVDIAWMKIRANGSIPDEWSFYLGSAPS